MGSNVKPSLQMTLTVVPPLTSELLSLPFAGLLRAGQFTERTEGGTHANIDIIHKNFNKPGPPGTQCGTVPVQTPGLTQVMV